MDKNSRGQMKDNFSRWKENGGQLLAVEGKWKATSSGGKKMEDFFSRWKENGRQLLAVEGEWRTTFRGGRKMEGNF